MSSRGSILVVADDAALLGLVIDALTPEGYQVRPANSAELALASVAAPPPDLLLVDIPMPGMHWLEVCRQLKADIRSRDIPIIIISGSGDVKERVEALRAGAVDVITKSIQREELLARVETRLELSRLSTQLQRKIEESTHDLVQVNRRVRLELAERERAEAALRESESRFRMMADTAPVMIVISGPDKQATFFNKTWLGFRHRSIEQELGWGWTEGVHPDDLDACMVKYSASFDARRDCHLEYRLRRADGEYRHILCTGVPVYQSGGVFVGYIASCVDITEFKRSQEERLALQKAESIGILASGIAHDFNNMLGSVFASADLALSELEPDMSAREHIQNINDVATRASGIVDLLTAYAASGGAPALESIDLSALVDELLHLMRDLFPSRGISVKYNLDTNLPPVLADGIQIRRVVVNLLTNAVEALEGKEGSITVSTSQVHDNRDGSGVTLADLDQRGYVCLAVADTGSGMSEEVLTKALDPFYSTKSFGRGMGLAVVQGIVRAHGGSIRVTSDVGSGCTFEVLLPCAPAAAGIADPDTVRGIDARSTPPLKVLLVEDEQILRVAIAKALEKRGFLVVPVPDGYVALEKLQDPEQSIDVVLLDMTLPGISGREVFAEIGRINPDLRTVLTSAREVDVRSFEGLDGRLPASFIRKPYRLDELERVLRQGSPQPD